MAKERIRSRLAGMTAPAGQNPQGTVEGSGKAARNRLCKARRKFRQGAVPVKPDDGVQAFRANRLRGPASWRTGGRGLLAAFGLALAAAASAQPEANGAGDSAVPAERARSAQDMLRASRPGGETGSDADWKRREEREARDLAAQEDMADWAQAMFWAALAQAVLSALGIVLIFVTFKEARRAADSGDKMAEEASKATLAAAEAAESGREANRIAHEGQRSHLRPYVYATELEARFDHIPSAELIADKGNAILKFRNFGITPAKHVQVLCDCQVAYDDGREAVVLEFESYSLGDLPPNDENLQEFEMAGIRAVHNALSKGKATLIFRGRLIYQDAYGTAFATRFSFGSSGPDYWAGQFRVLPDGNEAD